MQVMVNVLIAGRIGLHRLGLLRSCSIKFVLELRLLALELCLGPGSILVVETTLLSLGLLVLVLLELDLLGLERLHGSVVMVLMRLLLDDVLDFFFVLFLHVGVLDCGLGFGGDRVCRVVDGMVFGRFGSGGASTVSRSVHRCACVT